MQLLRASPSRSPRHADLRPTFGQGGLAVHAVFGVAEPPPSRPHLDQRTGESGVRNGLWRGRSGQFTLDAEARGRRYLTELSRSRARAGVAIIAQGFSGLL